MLSSVIMKQTLKPKHLVAIIIRKQNVKSKRQLLAIVIKKQTVKPKRHLLAHALRTDGVALRGDEVGQQRQNNNGGGGAPDVHRVLQEPPTLVVAVVSRLHGGEYPPHVVRAHGHGGKGGEPEIVDENSHGLAQPGVLALCGRNREDVDVRLN